MRKFSILAMLAVVLLFSALTLAGCAGKQAIPADTQSAETQSTETIHVSNSDIPSFQFPSGDDVLTPSEIVEFGSHLLPTSLYRNEQVSNGEVFFHFNGFMEKDLHWGFGTYKDEFTASSTLPPYKDFTYDAKNLQNEQDRAGGFCSAAWCEGVKGHGIGERVNMRINTLTHSFKSEDSLRFSSLMIVNGYAKDSITWENNSRIKTLRLYVGGKRWFDLHLSDTIKPQVFHLPENLRIYPKRSGESIPLEGRHGYQLDLSFEIVEVYPGKKFEDACITGIALDVHGSVDTWISPVPIDTITDSRDGQKYRTVKIGNQTWMAENLKYAGKDNKIGICNDNLPNACAKYGRLYDWQMIMNGAASSNASPSGVQGICPVGWHIPSDAEWTELGNAVGGAAKAGRKLKATNDWLDNANATDEYGFSARPGGFKVYNIFAATGYDGLWWSATTFVSGSFGSSWGRIMKGSLDSMERRNIFNSQLCSVRCLKDAMPVVVSSSPPGSTITDPRDGQKYRTVKIGGKTWMAENLNYAAQNSLCNGNDALNCDKYGRLYNWNTALTACPAGWRLPDTTDWNNLIDAAGGHDVAGHKLKAKTGWDNPGGTDDFGFSALPGGNINGVDGRFGAMGTFGLWWSSTQLDAKSAWYRSMLWITSQVNNAHTEKHFLHSVRCISD